MKVKLIIFPLFLPEGNAILPITIKEVCGCGCLQIMSKIWVAGGRTQIYIQVYLNIVELLHHIWITMFTMFTFVGLKVEDAWGQ